MKQHQTNTIRFHGGLAYVASRGDILSLNRGPFKLGFGSRGVTQTKEYPLNAPNMQELRRAAGEWLRKLREQQGISQRELAKRVGAEYYTFISQLETGRGRVPPEHYEMWAKALGVDTKLFVKTLLQYYDPVTFAILFKVKERAPVAAE